MRDKTIRRASINLFKDAVDKKGVLKLNDKGKTIRVFHKCVVRDWTDDDVVQFEKMDFEGRKSFLKDLFAEFGSSDAEVFVRASWEPEGVKEPYRTYSLESRGQSLRKHQLQKKLMKTRNMLEYKVTDVNGYKSFVEDFLRENPSGTVTLDRDQLKEVIEKMGNFVQFPELIEDFGTVEKRFRLWQAGMNPEELEEETYCVSLKTALEQAENIKLTVYTLDVTIISISFDVEGHSFVLAV